MLIGAYGNRALRVVAEHADVWNCPTTDIEAFRERSAALDAACAEIGRDPREIIRSVQLLVSRDDAAGVRRRLVELVAAGCTHLVLAPVPPQPSPPVAWLAEEIVQPMLAEGRWENGRPLPG